jgi:hypothetical protein
MVSADEVVVDSDTQTWECGQGTCNVEEYPSHPSHPNRPTVGGPCLEREQSQWVYPPCEKDHCH